MNYLLLVIPIGIFSLLIWAVITQRKQVLKDWETLDYLKKRCNEVNTKEEIEEFHKEFLEKASEINNPSINPELQRIDGFLRGLYKQALNNLN
jgi:hypothetical protein